MFIKVANLPLKNSLFTRKTSWVKANSLAELCLLAMRSTIIYILVFISFADEGYALIAQPGSQQPFKVVGQFDLVWVRGGMAGARTQTLLLLFSTTVMGETASFLCASMGKALPLFFTIASFPCSSKGKVPTPGMGRPLPLLLFPIPLAAAFPYTSTGNVTAPKAPFCAMSLKPMSMGLIKSLHSWIQSVGWRLLPPVLANSNVQFLWLYSIFSLMCELLRTSPKTQWSSQYESGLTLD